MKILFFVGHTRGRVGCIDTALPMDEHYYNKALCSHIKDYEIYDPDITVRPDYDIYDDLAYAKTQRACLAIAIHHNHGLGGIASLPALSMCMRQAPIANLYCYLVQTRLGPMIAQWGVRRWVHVQQPDPQWGPRLWINTPLTGCSQVLLELAFVQAPHREYFDHLQEVGEAINQATVDFEQLTQGEKHEHKI